MEKNRNVHLIITTANISKNICNKIYGSGYSYEKRINDYKKSFEIVSSLRKYFTTITILETCSKEKIDYLYDYNFIVYYSNQNNYFVNKGLNEMNHINNYLCDNSFIKDDDIVIKLSGRYFITNTNILNFTNKYNIIVKDDRDIYTSGLGVHTFYFAITKKLFFDFYKFIDLKFDDIDYKKNIAIEWEMKKFFESLNDEKYMILPQEKIGIITNTYYGDINCCKIEYV